ncbi:MAG: 2-hydroxychromene-2-carboxylate isomerase [Granulosicoccus sp.]
MAGNIDFYFDYSSPYGYLASERIEALAERHGRSVVWRPILLGFIFKVSKQAPLTEAPLKGEYSIMDFARSSREHKIAYQHPQQFPIGAVAASRATLWSRNHPDAAVNEKTGAFVHAIYRAYFVEGKDITEAASLSEIANATGLDGDLMIAALSEQSIKDALKNEVGSAIDTGIFGSPTMVVDGEQFWGHDRMEQLDRWLATGGW